MGFNTSKKATLTSLMLFWLFFTTSVFSSISLATTPSFSVVFSPDTISPGGVSTLTYTIDNSGSGAVPLSTLSFNDTLPTGVTIASSPGAITTCPNAVFTATASSNSIILSEARLGSGASCTLSVDVTSTVIATHSHTTADLITSAGNVSGASDDLVVASAALVLSSAFSSSTINTEEVTTLTYTLDATSSAKDLFTISFWDYYPAGLVVADVPNVSTTCSAITFAPGGGDTSYQIKDITMTAGSTCTVQVDVKPSSAGAGVYKFETSSGFYREVGNFSLFSLASATTFLNIEIEPVTAEFSSVNVPGTSSTLTFSIRNSNRNDITDLNFTNDLNATLSGLAATALPSNNFCGNGSTVTGSSTLSVAGVNLASGESCEFSVTVLVPANATPGSYTNTTSTINLTLGSTATTFTAISNTLRISSGPILSISNDNSVIAAGDTFTSTFTLTNTDSANSLSDVAFTMDIAGIMPSASISTLPSANSCGSGSSFTQTSDSNSTSILSVSGANLAAGASCNFDVTFTTPSEAVTQSYTFTTSTGSGTVNGSNVYFLPVSNSITVQAAPLLSMSLSSTSVAPGDSVNAEFTLNYGVASAADATNIGFTLDLDSVISGMAMSGGDQNNICGTGSSLTGTGTITFAGGTLSPDGACTFTAPISVPSGLTGSDLGSKTLTTSNLTAQSSSLNLTSSAQSETLLVTGLTFSYSYVPDTTLPNGTVIARYVISNTTGSPAASNMSFTHNYSSTITSMQATSLPASPCNGGAISGTTLLNFSGASLNGGENCTFDVTLSVPSNAADGSYISPTSGLSATVDGNSVAIDAASDSITVETLTLTLTSTADSSTSTSPIPVAISFSRDVVNFVSSDITVSNGSVTGFSGSGKEYTASITPTTDGTVTVDIASGVAEDSVDNSVTNPAATQLSFEYASTPATPAPTLVIGAPSASSTTTGPVTYTVTYTNASEVNLTSSAISLNNTGTSASVAVTNGDTSTPTVTLSSITGDGTLGISIAANTARNGTEVSAAVGPSTTFNVDNTGPTVTITDSVGTSVNAPFTATFTFNEAVSDFTSSDITANNANLSNFATVSSTEYTVLVNPVNQGAVTLDVAASAATDAVGNASSAATQLSVTYDTVSPTVVISTPSNSVKAAFTATMTFSEAVTGFDVNDISVTNGVASNFNSVSSTIYTATITPSTEGSVDVNVAASAAVDAASNNNTAASQLSVTYDTTAPTVSISGPTAATNAAFTATITFNEDVSGFVIGDIVASNANLGSFSATSAKVYTVEVTPTNDGSVTLDVAANVATDDATNGNTAATQFSVDYDATKPTLTIMGATAPTNAAFTATFTFSEDVSGFTVDDIVATNAALSSFASTSASVYTATVTPSSEGTVNLDVAADLATDTAGNGNTVATQYSVIYDVTAPTVVISAPSTSVNAAFTATFTFSEDVSGFDVNDISVTNASAGSFSTTSGSVYTALITPSAEGSVEVNVAASTALDAASNSNTAASQLSVTYDTTAPTVSISSPTTATNAVFTATFTFSEDVTGFTVEDIAVTNGNLDSFSSTSTSVYTVQVTPASEANVTLNVAASVAQDSAGNGNTAANQYSVLYDITAPGVVISGPTTPQKAPFTATFTFTEDVTGFAVEDITTVNANLSNFASTNASVYTALVTPVAEGNVTLDVAASSVTDSASNNNTAASQFAVVYDVTAPTVTISGPTSAQNAAFTATFTFSEDVTGFAQSDISAANASVSNFVATSASVYTATITPTSQDTVTIDVAASVAQDSADNSNTAANQYSVIYDTVAPDVTISGPTSAQNTAFTATFTFSEDVTGFSVSDVMVTNASLSSFSATSASVYTVTVTPSSDGSVTLDVGAASATDAAGNNSTAATQFSITYDATAPGLTISGPTAPQNAPFTATFTFSEDVTGFAVEDITAVNASLSNFASTSSAVYTATVTPTSDGSVTLDVPASRAIDSANNGNTAATQYAVDYDATVPTVTITGPTAQQNAAFTATFTFSENVTGFDASDITVVNAALSSFSATSAAVYTATVTPSAQGNVTLDVAAGVAQDSATNNNTAAVQYSVIYDSIAPALSSSAPQDDATLIALDSDIVLSFSESVQFNSTSSGTLQIVRLSDTNTELETITLTLSSGTLTGQGTGTIAGSVLTIDPTANLLAGANYAIRMSSDLLQDAANNSYAGISSNTPLNFATLPGVQILSDVSQLVEEKQQTATVTLALRSDTAAAINTVSDVTILLSFVGSTATAVDDYTVSGLTNNTITISAGTSEASFTLTSVNDSPLADEPEQISISVDSISTANAVEEQPQQVTINIVENAVPSATNLPTSISINEDTKTNLAFADVNVSDAEGDSVTMAITLSEGLLVSPLGSANSTTVTQNSGLSLSLSGTAEAITTYLDNQNAIAVIPPGNSSGPLTLSVTVSDVAETSSVQQIPITILPVNDNPRLLNGDLITFDMSQGSVDSTLSYSEVESGVTMTVNLDSGNLQVSDLNTLGGTAGDVLYSTVANGTSLTTITFGQQVNLESLDFVVNSGAVPSSITFTPVGGNGIAFTVNAASLATDSVGTKVEFNGWTNVTGMTITSGDGTFAPGLDNVTVSAALSNVTVVEDTLTPLDLSSLALTDIDSSLLTLNIAVSSGTLSLLSETTSSGATAGVNDNIISVSGSVAQIDAWLNETTNVQFLPAANANGTGLVTATLSVDDNNGSGARVLQTQTIDVTAVNDAPVISGLGGDSVNFVQAGDAVLIDASNNASVSDVDDTDFNGGTLTVSITAGGTGSEDLLSFDASSVSLAGLSSGDNVLVDTVIIGTLGNAITEGNDLVVNLNENATLTRVDALLQGITYFNSNITSLSATNRTVSTTLSDGDDVSDAVVSTITFTPLDNDTSFNFSTLFSSISPDANEQSRAQTAVIIETVDSGTDGLPTTITSMNFSVTGTLELDNLSYVIRQVDNSNFSTIATYEGRYANGLLNFSDNIEIANGSSTNSLYLEVWFNNESGLVEGSTVSLSIDPANGVSVLANGSQLGARTQPTATLTLNVTASTLSFTQQPSGSVSGVALTTVPVVSAVDGFGNIDSDFQENVLLNVQGSGALTSNTAIAASGVATFGNLAYYATSDGESFSLVASLDPNSSLTLSSATSNSVISNVVASNLRFATEPAPTTINAGVATDFSTVPVINAVDALGNIDLDYQSDVILSVSNAQGSANLSVIGDRDALSTTVTLSFVQGSVAFDGLNITYQSLGQEDETFNLLATSGALSSATSTQITASNLPVLEGVPLEIVVVEDVPSPLDLSTLILNDTQGDDLTLALSVNAGTLSHSAGDGNFDEVTIVGSGTAELTLTATATEIMSYLTATDVLSYLTILNDDSNATLTIASSQAQGDDGISNVSLNITAVNDPPQISGDGSATITEGDNYSFVPQAFDVEGDILTFSIENQPSWLTFDEETGTLQGLAGDDNAGTYENIIISVSDGAIVVSLDAFTITVNSSNVAPVISGTPATSVDQDVLYSFVPVATDDNGDALTFAIQNGPAWASFDATTGALTGTPGRSDVGVYSNIVISVSDGEFTAQLPAFNISVIYVNAAPVISGEPALTVDQDALYSFLPQATDTDGDALTFAIQNRPDWLSFDTSTGSLTGTPVQSNVGVYSNIIISVTDGEAEAQLSAFSITVVNVNDAPVISGSPSVTVDQDAAYSFVPQASDIDEDTLTFAIENLPTWLNFDTANGALTGTPGNSEVGVYNNIIISVSDGELSAQLPSFSITVVNVNDAPEISGTPATSVKVLRSYSFTPVATDIDGDSLSFSIQNAPSWSQFDTSTGTLSGTPGAGASGLYGSIVISVTDGELSAQLPAFNIEVLVNSPPVISGSPEVLAQVGAAYQFQPQVSDEDNDTITFSIINPPVWASFDTGTGALTGIPANADINTYENIVISASDGVNTVNLPAFAIRVCDICDNRPPEISGTPASTVTAGNTYSFVPQASDANDDPLSFSIANQPVWASFDSASGALTGSPLESNVGNYGNIIITVSDGENSVSLAQFSIEVLSGNSAPTISGTPLTSVAQGQQYQFIPTANDADGDNLIFSIVNRPGWMSFNPQNGTLRGTPGADDVATYSGIVISVTDNANSPVSLSAFSIEVIAQNSVPVIAGVPRTSITTGVDYEFVPTASDADGDTLTFSIVNQPTWLAFDTQTGRLSGTATTDDIGTFDGIGITVTDGEDSVSLPEFSITVVNENDAPVASDMSLTVTEDNALTIVADATDINQDELQHTVVTGPTNGSLENTSAGWIYTPTADFNGGDTFVFEVSDGELTSEQATVTLQVIAENDTPVAEEDALELDQIESGVYLLDVVANDTDVDITTNGDTITLQTVTSNFGVAAVVDNQLQLTVDANFIGTVEFSYSIRDAESASATASGTVTINGVDDINAPVVTVPEDVTVNATGLFTRVELGTASAVDASGNTLPVTLVNDETNFSPGNHTVFWQAEDSFGTTTTESQQVNVNPIVSVTAVDSVAEGTTFELRFLLNGDAPAYPFVVEYSVAGTAQGSGVDYVLDSTSVTFAEGREQTVAVEVIVDSDIEADETIEVTLADNQNASSSNSVIVTISESNIAPTVTLSMIQNADPRTSVARDEGTVLINAEVSDPNPQDTVAIDWSSEDLINLSADETVFQFDPVDLAVGFYTVGVYVNDDGDPILDSTDAITFEVVESFTPLSETEDSDGDLIPDAQEGYGDSDGDGVPDYLDAIDDCNVVAAQATNQAEFLVEGQSGTCMRRGEISSQNESNGVQVVLNDGTDGNRPQRMNNNGEMVSMIANDLPEDINFENVGGVYDAVLYDLAEPGQAVFMVIPLNSPIPENAVYRTYNTVTQQWSSFVNDDQNALYSAVGEEGFCPAPGAEEWQPGLMFGSWCIQLLIQDGGPNDEDNQQDSKVSGSGGLSLFVSDNTAPVAQDDTYQMNWNTQLEADVLVNDSDVDEDVLTIASALANIGTVEIIDGTEILYTAQSGFSGTDTISYIITDGNGGSANAIATLTIIGNRAPGASDDFAETDNRTAIEIDVLANDVDVDGDEITIVTAAAETGSVTITEINTLLYTPDFDFSGLDTISYTIEDTSGATGSANVSVFVDGNEAPVAGNDSVTTEFETAVTIDVLSNDSDPDNDTLMIIDVSAENGTVAINDDNSLIYTPNTGFSGEDVVAYTISDGVLNASAVVNVTVLPEAVVPPPPAEPVDVNNASGGAINQIFALLLLIMIFIRARERRFY